MRTINTCSLFQVQLCVTNKRKITQTQVAFNSVVTMVNSEGYKALNH